LSFVEEYQHGREEMVIHVQFNFLNLSIYFKNYGYDSVIIMTTISQFLIFCQLQNFTKELQKSDLKNLSKESILLFQLFVADKPFKIINLRAHSREQKTDFYILQLTHSNNVEIDDDVIFDYEYGAKNCVFYY